jgi:hypothetical protein
MYIEIEVDLVFPDKPHYVCRGSFDRKYFHRQRLCLRKSWLSIVKSCSFSQQQTPFSVCTVTHLECTIALRDSYLLVSCSVHVDVVVDWDVWWFPRCDQFRKRTDITNIIHIHPREVTCMCDTPRVLIGVWHKASSTKFPRGCILHHFHFQIIVRSVSHNSSSLFAGIWCTNIHALKCVLVCECAIECSVCVCSSVCTSVWVWLGRVCTWVWRCNCQCI